MLAKQHHEPARASRTRARTVRTPLVSSRPTNSLKTRAMDAAQPFDFEAQEAERRNAVRRMRVGVVGFGTFGQFLARRIVQQGHEVIATSRGDYADKAAEIGVSAYYRDADDFAEAHPDVVVLCTSILSTESVLAALPLQRLLRSTLVVDVLSVKAFPKDVLLRRLPKSFDILCTHPMFGPDSGRGSWEGLTFMYDPVRIAPDLGNAANGKLTRSQRLAAFLDIFSSEGCRMVEMTCEEHDRLAASSQFITHTIGRVLGAMKLEDTAINTRGYESLLSLVENTANDSFDLYYGLFMYNDNSIEELHRLEQSFDDIKQRLFAQLHARVRAELFSGSSVEGAKKLPDVPHGNGHAATAASESPEAHARR